MGEDVRAYLSSKGLTLKTADKRNVNTSCFWCGEDPQKRGRLYINVDPDADIPGLFQCHLCGEHGSLKKIKRHFGDPVDDGKDPGIVYYDVLAAGASFFHKNLNAHPEAVAYYKDERGLTLDTIKQFKLGWADGNVIPHLKSLGFSNDEIRGAGFMTGSANEFYVGVYTIPYYIGPTCVGVRQKEPGGKYKQPSGFFQRIFNVDAARGAEEVVLTEGEFDAIVLSQMGYKALGVPGATQWNESWNNYVRDAKRVWAVFDNDDAGRKGAEKIRELVGPRCTALTIPPKTPGDDDDANDISDWIVNQNHTADDFSELLRKNKKTLLITVGEAMAEWESVQGKEGIKFNFRKLDDAIAPGLLAGEVVVLLAKTGTGKSLWIENTFELMAQQDPNLRFLFMSLEQTRGDWFERAQRIRAFYRIHDDEFKLTSLEPEAVELWQKLIKDDVFDWWNPRLMLTDKNRMAEDHIRASLDDYQFEMGCLPDVLAIDYLGYLARGFKGGDRYEKTSEAIMAVKEIAKDYKLPILLPHQVNRTGKDGQRLEIDMARDAGSVEETGDFVFMLWNPDHGMDAKTGKIGIKIGKSRHGGKDAEFFYQWGRQTLVMVPEGMDRFHQEAAWELNYTHSAAWHRVIYQHCTGKRPDLL